nr:MAG TPA: hypothetical protein [Caudoviricetes sp.]
MSVARNPYYYLPGGADLPGDVRVSDTADATKTAAGGWAASPAAVAGAESIARPDYTNRTRLGTKGTFTIDTPGFVQFCCSSGSTEASIFHRVKINGIVVDQGHTESRNYTYYSSPLFPVSPGDTLETIGDSDKLGYDTYFYNLRKS